MQHVSIAPGSSSGIRVKLITAQTELTMYVHANTYKMYKRRPVNCRRFRSGSLVCFHQLVMMAWN
jgi:hypothetical protein